MSTYQQRLTVVPGVRFLAGLDRAWQAIVRVGDRICGRLRLEADRREFESLEGRVLRDLGVSRGDFESFRREALRRRFAADFERAGVQNRGDNS